MTNKIAEESTKQAPKHSGAAQSTLFMSIIDHSFIPDMPHQLGIVPWGRLLVQLKDRGFISFSTLGGDS